MKVLYFDTETNGIPKVRGGPDTDVNNHPELVEIAWQIWQDGVLVNSRSLLPKPDPIMEWKTEHIHHISRSVANIHGIPMADVLSEFKTACTGCDVIITHNLAFDMPVVKCAFLRVWPDAEFSWLPTRQICTMVLTTQLCKLPFPNSKYPQRPGKYKQPKLKELHKVLFGDEGNYEQHRAGGDVESLVACSQELIRRNILVL